MGMTHFAWIFKMVYLTVIRKEKRRKKYRTKKGAREGAEGGSWDVLILSCDIAKQRI